MRMGRSVAAVSSSVALLVACAAHKTEVAVSDGPPPAPTTTPAQSVAAVVVANGCAHLGKANAKLAESAMNQLVDGCGSFKGSVRFTAQLLADGSIFFQPGPSKAEAIPVCVLEHPLKHKIRLTEPCALDVRLEQSTVQVPLKGDGGT
jgi:hypothetical protein